MTTKRLAYHNTVAVFDRFEEAARALDALEREGFTAEELSLLGPEHVMRPGTGEPKEAPRGAAGGIGKATLAGAGAGATVGGALGAGSAAAAAAIPGVGWAVGAAAGLGLLAGAVMGHIPGALLGAEAGARKNMMLQQTFHPLLVEVEQGKVLLGVHSDEPSRVTEAQDVLETFDAERVVRLDADETYGPPGDMSAIADRSIPSSHPERPGGELGRDRVPTSEGRTIGMEERADPEDEDPSG